MQCLEVRKRLDAWVDDELPTHEAERIARHLQQCPACRLEAREVRRIGALLNALPAIDAPADLSRKTLRAFRDNFERPRMAQWWRGLTLVMRGVVCAAALAGLLFGAVMSASIAKLGSDTRANPYQNLYASKGILP